MRMKTNRRRRIKTSAIIELILLAAIAAAVFRVYVSDYYRADAAAEQALESDTVLVEQTDYGWFFDGPSEDTALVFYPGGKVEETGA